MGNAYNELVFSLTFSCPVNNKYQCCRQQKFSTCTGSLITPTYVMTAAHCTMYITEVNQQSRLVHSHWSRASLGKLLLAKQFLDIDIDVDQSAPEDIICN